MGLKRPLLRRRQHLAEAVVLGQAAERLVVDPEVTGAAGRCRRCLNNRPRQGHQVDPIRHTTLPCLPFQRRDTGSIFLA